MTAIVVKAFNGLKPIVDPRLLDNSEAQVAKNVRLISGALAPLRATTDLKSTVLAAPSTIYRYGSSATETNYWLEFAQDTDIMRSPIAADQYERLYWTNGESRPRYAPNSLILSGSNYPGASYELGIPAPSTKVIISSFSPVVNYTTVARDYVMTFYSPSSTKESIPSAVFTVQAVDGQTVAFSNITTNNLSDATITKKRLYRKVSGTYRRVTELDLAVTTYNDSATDASLAAAATLPSGVGSAPSAPLRAPTASAGTATTTPAGVARSYVYTITNYLGAVGDVTQYYNESAPSAVRTVTADNTQTVTIGGLVNNLGGQGFRIYRKDPTSTAYQLVATVPATQTSVTDVIASTTLGPVLANDGYSVPSATPTGSVNSSSATTAVKRVYMITFLDASGNESGESPASAVVDVVDGQTSVTVTHSETIPAGVTKKRLYRQTVTLSGGILVLNDNNWKLVGETTASTTSTTDVATEASLTTSLAAALRNLPPAPAATPVSNATIPPKQVPESRTYVYTYVSAYGEEGPPAEASDVVDLDPEQPVTITLGGPPTGSYNITLKRIYRSSTVGSRAEFQFVAEIPVATTSYIDTVDQGALGEVLPSTGWVAPPAGLKGLRLMANGAAVGFVGKTLYLSEPNLPHAWPYQYPIDDEIVGIGVFGQSVAVLTKSYPYLFQGIDPAAMASTKMPLPQACASKRSIGETGDGVIYASPDGLVSIGATVGVITSPTISRQQWQQYNPSTMQSYLHNGRVVIFYTGLDAVRGVMVLDLSGQGALMTTANINEGTGNAVTAGYYDAKTDMLYLAKGTNIVRWDAGSNLTLTWRSKLYRLPYQMNFAVAQVRASAYPVTFTLFADGASVHTQTVANGDQFRLPSGFLSLDYEFEVSGSSTITEVLVATSAMELKAA